MLAYLALLKQDIYGILYLNMGAITIKIPQEMSGTFEITDRDVAERILRELKQSSGVEKSPVKNKPKDFSKLSAWADKLREHPDADMLEVLATAEKLRKGWDR